MRVVVVGDSGSGKTSVAAAIAGRVGLPHVELDALYHGPGWAPAESAVFRQRVADATAGSGWVADGNYLAVRDLLWPRATVIVWLDLPLRVTLPRLVRRTASRWLRREELWNGNRERLRDVVHPEHPLWWTLRKHRTRRHEYEAAMDERWARLRTTGDVDRWLGALDRLTA